MCIIRGMDTLMKIFILTLQFLTRIPLRFNLNVDESDFAKGVVYFPIAGLIISAFNLLIYYLTSMFMDGIFPLVCYVLANVAITGGLHLDGLADTCDGIYSSRTKEKMLEIMKDSRIGTNGTIAVFMDLMLRVAILFNAPKESIYYALLLVPVISRTMLVIVMQISKYARANGMGGLFLEKQSPVRTMIACLIGMALSYAILGVIGIGMFILGVITVLLFRGYIYSKIDGMTGDTVGAANEIVELVLLTGLVIAWRYGIV